MSLFHPPKLLTATEYALDLCKAIGNARNEIALTSTTLRDDDPRSHDIIEALCAAADRGVAVSVCVDTFTYLEPKEFILRFPRRQPARAMRALQLERKLKQHGIMFQWLGRKASAIVYGRTHSKWTVVDDTIYSFGGVNLDTDSFDNVDYVFRLRDARLASVMITEHLQVRRADRGGGAFRSHKYDYSDKTSVLFDGGLVADSLIYRRAHQLALEAKSVLFVSQYSPTGKLARVFSKKDTKLYFNSGKDATLINKFIIGISKINAKRDTLYTKNSYLHAKFIIYTMPGGKKVAISGSHNFMFGSGLVGTREIAIETTDIQIINQLESFYKKYVA